MKPEKVVESGYDKIYQEYHDRRAKGFSSNRKEVDSFAKLVPVGSRILDAGCGSGYAAGLLTKRGFRVVGIDISKNMIRLAEDNVPEATFLRMDMRELDFPEGYFDGVVCLYSIIHVQKRYHLKILEGFRRVLKPSGVILICTGWGDYTGTEEDWLGMGEPMYWSHFDKNTNLELLTEAGFEVLSSERSEEKDGGVHLFVLARKRLLTPSICD